MVPFGVTTSPYLLQAVLKHHLTVEHEEEAVKQLFHNLYVDNFSRTYESETQMIEEKPRIESLLAEARMPLQEWASNSPKFNKQYNVESEQSLNVLGICWNNQSDTLHINLNLGDSNQAAFTKRSFLSKLS